jgi:hypothetical protein
VPDFIDKIKIKIKKINQSKRYESTCDTTTSGGCISALK